MLAPRNITHYACCINISKSNQTQSKSTNYMSIIVYVSPITT